MHGTEPAPGPGGSAPRFSTVVVFIVGGCTYDEAAIVAGINAGTISIGGAAGSAGSAAAAAPATPPFRVILGGTAIHNSKTFLAELQALASGGGGGGSVSVGVAGAGVDLR